MKGRGAGARRVGTLLTCAALVLITLTGLQLVQDRRADERGPARSAADSPAAAAPARDPEGTAPLAVAAPRRPRLEARRPAPVRPGEPRRVLVPDLGITADVVPIEASGAVLTPPADPTSLGWWAAGARPGERRGSVLVTGHTVRAGGGALDDLEQVEAGGIVRVGTDEGVLEYVVAEVRVLTKDQLASEAPDLFDPAGPARLVLVTCEDWDGTAYRSNVVVVAEPVA